MALADRRIGQGGAEAPSIIFPGLNAALKGPLFHKGLRVCDVRYSRTVRLVPWCPTIVVASDDAAVRTISVVSNDFCQARCVKNNRGILRAFSSLFSV